MVFISGGGVDLNIQGYPADNQRLPLIVQGSAAGHHQEPVERPGGLPFLTLLLTVEGDGEVIVLGSQAVAQPGTAILLLADTPYAYHALSDIWITHFITFSGTACEMILGNLGLDRSGVYYVSDPENLDKSFRSLDALAKSSGTMPHRLLSKALYALLLDLAVNVRYLNTRVPAVKNDALRSVIHYLEAHYAGPVSLDDLAAVAGWRKEYLCAVFKKQMGQTIVHFLQALRVAHARIELTQYPEKSVQEIAVRCGFESASYFCRVFRQVEHNSPQRYRQRHQGVAGVRSDLS